MINKCKVNWCNNNNLYENYGHNGYCCRHYRQIQRCGKILKRTIRDKNEIIDCGDYYEICLYDIQSKKVAKTKIDKKDLEKVKNYKWGLDGKGYVITRINCINKNIYLHDIINNKNKNKLIVDHINHDTLDNRKQNLRLVTRSQNNMNKKLQINNTSGTSGVFWNKINKNWNVYIKKNNNRISLGTFYKKEKAIKSRKIAEQKYFGEFAYQNNI